MDFGYWNQPSPETEREIMETDVDNPTINAVKNFVRNNVMSAYESRKRNYEYLQEKAQRAKEDYDEYKRTFDL